MASGDRELVASLRSELAALEPTRACDRRAVMAGLGRTAIRGDRPALARLVMRLSRDTESSGGPGVAGRSAAAAVGRSAAGTGSAAPAGAFRWETAADHCRAAYLRGLFLARGSLSLTGGRPHLEFVVSIDDANLLAARLATLGPPPGVRVRRGRGVVTWKSGEAIGTFLRRIGAVASLLEIESRQVARSVRGDLNRLINSESANLGRIADASARQLGAIAVLAADGRLDGLSLAAREVARLRVATPETSITELAEELQVPRGRVQRALERIEALALQEPDPGGLRHGAERPAAHGPGAPSPKPRGVA